MKDLLESLDSAVFTPELKANIQAKFAGKLVEVEDKYKTQLDESIAKISELECKLSESAKLEEKVEAYTEYIKEEYSSKAEAYGEYVKEEIETKAEAYAQYVTEQIEAKAEAYGEYVKEEISKTVSSYLDKVVESFVEDNRIVIDESVEVEKTKAMLEGLDSIIHTAGKSIVEIQESFEADKKSDSVLELKAKIDSLIKENADLKAEQLAKEKESIIESIAKDLTLVQRDSFDRLAKFVSLSESDASIYRSSLEKIKEEVVGKVDESSIITEKTTVDDKKASHKRFF